MTVVIGVVIDVSNASVGDFMRGPNVDAHGYLKRPGNAGAFQFLFAGGFAAMA